MASSGSLWVSLVLKTQEFTKGLGKAKKGLKGFKKDTNSIIYSWCQDIQHLILSL